MALTAVAVYILPLLGCLSETMVLKWFGAALLLFVGWPFALAGHYDMFNCTTPRSRKYFPLQEKVAVVVILSLLIVYGVVAARTGVPTTPDGHAQENRRIKAGQSPYPASRRSTWDLGRDMRTRLSKPKRHPDGFRY